LGKLHERGKGVEQDFAKAITLYLQAHAAGNPDATFNLGVLYSADVDAQLGCVA
jgi:TPR repeat protein